MDSRSDGQRNTHSLTAKEWRFVRLIVQGATKASAYRQSYSCSSSPRNTATSGSKLCRRPHIRHALELIEQGQIPTGMIFAGEADSLVLKKLFDIVAAPSRQSYVQLQALRIALDLRKTVVRQLTPDQREGEIQKVLGEALAKQGAPSDRSAVEDEFDPFLNGPFDRSFPEEMAAPVRFGSARTLQRR